MNNQYMTIKEKEKKNAWLIHTMVWLLLFAMPFILMAGKTIEASKLVEHSWIPLVYFAILFYLNYLWVVDKYLFAQKAIWFVVINVIVIVALVSFNQLIKPFFFNQFKLNHLEYRSPDFHQKMPIDKSFQVPPPPMEGMKPSRKIFFYIDIVSMFLPIAVAIALKASERWKRMERQHAESENAKLNSELQHLKYQIQPHFFFNSLNNIYSLVDSSPEKAKETIHSLSKLMRYLLYETNVDKVPLSSEIAFMARYIELMKLRTSAHTEVKYTFPTAASHIMVAPLLFISLIENSFKHGILPKGTSKLEFTMKIEDRKVIFTTRNPYFPKPEGDLSGSAIGLDNIRKRLEILYPGRNVFSTHIEGDEWLALLIIETEN